MWELQPTATGRFGDEATARHRVHRIYGRRPMPMLDRTVLYLASVILFFAWFIDKPVTMAIMP